MFVNIQEHHSYVRQHRNYVKLLVRKHEHTMSGFTRVRVTSQQREDFTACSASERQWLERNSKMTISGCNEALGFPIAQVDEVRPCIMLTRQHADLVPPAPVHRCGRVSADHYRTATDTEVHCT
jgi:hypothetical protein